jgi:hypothetical protein
LGTWLVFSVLMGTSVVAAKVLMMVSGAADARRPAVVVSVLVVASLLAVVGYVRVGAERPAEELLSAEASP